MQVGIIGAGNVGAALARASARARHGVFISSNDGAEQGVAREVGGAAVGNIDLVAAADVVILAVPFEVVAGVVQEVGDGLNGKVLIDVTNRFTGDQLGAPSNAEQIQQMAPGARVVKAINTVFAANQDSPVVDGVQLDGFVAADDADAKRVVIEYVKSLGFRPVDVGPLAMARALEGMGALNISLNMKDGAAWRSGWKLVGPVP